MVGLLQISRECPVYIYSIIRPSIVEFTGDKDLALKNSEPQKKVFCSRTAIDRLTTANRVH